MGSKLAERSPKLKDPDHVCCDNVKRWRDRIKSYLTDCLTDGIKSGEFIDAPVQETVNMLIALIKGLIRQQIRKMDNLNGVKDAAAAIWQSLSAESGTGTLTGIVGTVSPKLQTPPDRLIKSLSFSHFAELIAIEHALKRTFYEIECIRGNWSVREFKRQIASLYYERSGLSKNKEKLAELVQSGAEPVDPELSVRDPYIFEFLGLKSHEVMGESDLEDHPLVEYALAGMDNKLFVSKYQLKLPKKEEMQQFLVQHMREFTDAEPV